MLNWILKGPCQKVGCCVLHCLQLVKLYSMKTNTHEGVNYSLKVLGKEKSLHLTQVPEIWGEKKVLCLLLFVKFIVEANSKITSQSSFHQGGRLNPLLCKQINFCLAFVQI